MPDTLPPISIDRSIADAALAGLRARPKTLPPKLFYDALGCALFEQITRLPEYYLTRTEMALLRRIAPEIGAILPAGAEVVEYGASSPDKIGALLPHMRRPSSCVLVDVAAQALEQVARHLRRHFPTLAVHVVCTDFLAPLDLPNSVGSAPRVGFFPGSTIGNLEPAVAVRFLRGARRTLGAKAHLLVGVDLRKDPQKVVAAYDDAAGVTAAFNRNILARLNREAGADFDPYTFTHLALWNDAESRIEMHLVSCDAQTVRVAGEAIRFAAGESIHTENSYKHTPAGFASIAAEAGWERVQLWTDRDDLFSVHLLRTGE